MGQRRVENRRKKPLRTDDEGYFFTSEMCGIQWSKVKEQMVKDCFVKE